MLRQNQPDLPASRPQGWTVFAEPLLPLLMARGGVVDVHLGDGHLGHVDQGLHPDLPGSEDLAIQALQRGAASYVPKVNLARDLLETAEGVLEVAQAKKLIKIRAKVVGHSKYVIFQLAEVAVPRQLFAAILERIARLRLVCASG